MKAKMNTYVRHIALVVPDLRAAERYYQSVFGMEIIGREAVQADGEWYSLPFDKSWDDASAAGVALDMVGLRKEGFVLVLFRGNAAPGQVAFIGLTMTLEEIAGVRSRLPKEMQGGEEAVDSLEFSDPYQITWQISLPGNEFRTAGVFADRWLKI